MTETNSSLDSLIKILVSEGNEEYRGYKIPNKYLDFRDQAITLALKLESSQPDTAIQIIYSMQAILNLYIVCNDIPTQINNTCKELIPHLPNNNEFINQLFNSLSTIDKGNIAISVITNMLEELKE